ncbi:hypothetical protein AB0F68_28070 [Micromonospora sp. NPDC023966]|uniref:hypothetical protein n=1 Tax=Micromonospora sp. NPDC023966 TaxID=3154699 RepID=UPI00340614AA
MATSTGSSRRTRASIWTDDQAGPSSRLGYSTGPAEAGANFGPQKGAGAAEVALLERDPSLAAASLVELAESSTWRCTTRRGG